MIRPPRKTYPDSENILLRDYLAIDRTRLANQRTLLSFLRSALYLVVSALAIMRVEFLKNLAPWAWVALGLAGLVAIIGLVNYLLVRRRVNAAYHYHDERREAATQS